MFFLIFNSNCHQVTSRPFSPRILIDQLSESLAVIWFDQMGKFMDNHIVLNEPWHFGNAMGYSNRSTIRIATSVASLLVGNPTNGLPVQEVIKIFSV